MEQLPDIFPFERRRDELDAQMAEPAFYANPRRAAEVSREQQKLQQLITEHREHARLDREVGEAAALLKDPAGDPDLKELAAAELPELQRRREQLRQSVLLAMIPPEPTDSRNTVMEIRAGTGGDEASLFAAELFRMYSKYADARGWKVQPMSSSESERGGFKEVIFLITGSEVYRQLKFESGVHRVQRVPVTEANGRIHTSTVTVAVLPEAEEVDVDLDPNDLKIDVYRSSGPGGQSVNTTDSAVRITHLPTGIVVSMQDEKSQIQNRAKALIVLRSRLLKAAQDAQANELGDLKRSQLGGGGRSEKIRTYNFKENRVTDHRINLTTYTLDAVLGGDLDTYVDALMADQRARQLAESDGR